MKRLEVEHIVSVVVECLKDDGQQHGRKATNNCLVWKIVELEQKSGSLNSVCIGCIKNILYGKHRDNLARTEGHD